MSVLAPYWACRHTETSQVLHMVGEAGANLWGSTQSVDALFGALWLADEVAVHVSLVALATGSDTAEV
jgi:hypothetical protein